MLTNHQGDADKAIIAAVDTCIALNERHSQLIAADRTDGADPELGRLDDEIGQLVVTVRGARAQTLAGVAAKARLFRALFPEAEMKHDYQVDAEILGNSICIDLELFDQAMGEPVNAA